MSHAAGELSHRSSFTMCPHNFIQEFVCVSAVCSGKVCVCVYLRSILEMYVTRLLFELLGSMR